ncbi:amidohydrolase [Oceanicola sp. 22II-s10i]|uniref:amidohydrolase family protein n=1 Tax=Oceanicola sp. 22II-s10i TaxID=1317116 RepID=UPI000B5264DA|nr:amidohydrolase family protein [Oceanicola sp. 22II-s10i]OWU82937.1 amidohydrolase [Oceanicola sp. 22II-s10i]
MQDFDPTAKDFPPPALPVREDWLARTDEAALEPDLPIVDPHHHLWNRPHERYLTDEILADVTAGHNVVATVFVQCRSHYRQSGPEHLKFVGETEFVRDFVAALPADSPKVCAGMVAHANMMQGAAVAEVLDAHLEAGPGLVKGIRDMTTYDPEISASFGSIPPGRLLDATWREGFAQLAPRGLSYDLYAFHTQLTEALDLARAFPDQPIVLNHIGGPLGIKGYASRRDQVFAEWSAAMREIGKCPNVSIKVGGVGMHNLGFGFEHLPAGPTGEQIANAIGPYVETCIEAFGPDRAMFESNFPVDKGAVGYVPLWNAFKRLTANHTAAERAALFAGTADRVYRLGLDL